MVKGAKYMRGQKQMRFDIITVFPESFLSYFNASILNRAQKRGLISIRIHGLRKLGKGRHKQLDDKPYGGGPGMVLMAEPILKAVATALRRIKNHESRIKRTLVVLLSAKGKQFSQKLAYQWSRKFDTIVLISGRYEGVDERVKTIIHDSKFMIQEISIGPYVLTGGELPAMTVIDAVSRHIPGVLGKQESLEERRYGVGVPMFSRPEAFKWKGKIYRVPKVLLSGNHNAIAAWREKHSK